MGAELILVSLVFDRKATLDFDAGFDAIRCLSAENVEDPELLDDHDPNTDAGLAAIRARLVEELGALKLGLAHSREVAWIEVRGAIIYLTGGLSYGEPPTALSETVTRLRAVSGVLSAVGFEGEL